MAGRTYTAEQVSQAQLDALGERMDKGFSEIKEMLKGFDERVRGLETREAGCQPILTSRIDAAWRKIDSHETELGRLTKVVDKLETVAKWLLGIIAALISALLIAFFTGKIDIIFR